MVRLRLTYESRKLSPADPPNDRSANQLLNGLGAVIDKIMRPAAKICYSRSANIDSKIAVERSEYLLNVDRSLFGFRRVSVRSAEDDTRL